MYRKSMATPNGHSMQQISSQETNALSNGYNKMRFDDQETLQISFRVWAYSHLLTAYILWAFWYMKDTILWPFAIFLTSSLCFSMPYTCSVPLYIKGGRCTFNLSCMPWKIDIFTIFINELENTWDN